MSQPAPSDAKIAVSVLSMHRSGSSALTRALNLLGFDLGNPETLAEAKSDNPTGFWEQLPIQDLNSRMLQHVGREWDTFAPLPDTAHVEVETRFGEEVRSLIAETFGDRPAILWKDPRGVLLYPVWAAAFKELGYANKVVLGIRHPSEVAASLHQRNGFPRLKGIAIWVAYYAQIINTIGETPLGVVEYGALLENWRQELSHCLNALDLPWPDSIPDEKFSCFLRKDLRHNSPAPLLPKDLPFGFPAETLYEEIRHLPERGAISTELNDALTTFVESSLVLAEDLETVRTSRDGLASQHADLEVAYRVLEEENVKLQNGYRALEENHLHILKEHQALEAEYGKLEAAYLNLQSDVNRDDGTTPADPPEASR